MKILVLNTGSSSAKCSLFQAPKLNLLWEKQLDWSSSDPPSARDKAVQSLLKQAPVKSNEIRVIGHRVVHGGERFVEPALVTAQVKEEIRRLSKLAPLHNPINLEGIDIMERIFPKIPQVAVFDTAFFSTLSEVAYTYPGPYEWKELGIRRFGFHGISHHYCAHQGAQLASQDLKQVKMITCHLGNGASLAAIDKGKSIDTTMGFTPLEGLMMGTRCGSIDPGIILYLLRKQTSLEALDKTLNFESGLKGICGNNDMRTILNAVRQGDTKAKLAYDLYVHCFKKQLGSMLAALGGLDTLVFTGGIGENVPSIREAASKSLSFLGAAIDPSKNATCQEDLLISQPHSKVHIAVVHAQENLAIAKACLTFC